MKLNLLGVMYTLEYKVIEGYAEVDFVNARITINPSYPKEAQRKSLIHEILHVISEDRLKYVYKGLANSDINEDTVEHMIIDPMSNGIHDIFKANPKLRELLWGVQ